MRRSFVDLTLEPLLEQPRLPARQALQALSCVPTKQTHAHVCQVNQWSL